MPTFIAFLRGINVGGHRLGMDRLRELFDQLDLKDVSTFIASGNVIFASDSNDPGTLTARIERHLARELGYEVPTFLRTPEQLSGIVATGASRSADRAGTGAGSERSVYVCFLREPASEAVRANFEALATELDEFHVAGTEVYWLIQGKLSESPLFDRGLDEALQGAPVTMRNMNTLRRIATRLGVISFTSLLLFSGCSDRSASRSRGAPESTDSEMPAVDQPGVDQAQPSACGSSPQNFIYFGLDRDRIVEPSFLSNAAVAGAQLKYTWRELEPERGAYALDAIRDDLAYLDRNGKRLFIQVQDVSFDEGRVNVPDYLLHDPAFHGGAQLHLGDHTESGPVPEGWVSRRWDPAVLERFAALLGAIAREFDGQLAGLNLPETAIGFGRDPERFPSGFSHETYYQGIKNLMSAARESFRASDVIIYANFMPGEELPDRDRGFLTGVYAHADRIHMGVGGPDLLPNRWYQRQHSLPLIARRAPGVVAGVAVQWGNLEDTNRSTGERVTVDELYRYAVEELHLDYIFWGRQEPYYSEDVLPFLSRIPDAGPGSDRGCHTSRTNPASDDGEQIVNRR